MLVSKSLNMFLKSCFTITLLFYLLRAENDFLHHICQLFPLTSEGSSRVLKSLRKVVSEVFLLPVKISLGHAIVTLTIFMVFRVEYLYFATFLSFLFSAIPFVPDYVICSPWSFAIMSRGSYGGFLLLIVHTVSVTTVDTWIYEKNVGGVTPYVATLSLAMGLPVFGMGGILIGPLVVCLGVMIHSLADKFVQYQRLQGRWHERREAGRLEIPMRPNLQETSPLSLHHDQKEAEATPQTATSPIGTDGVQLGSFP